MSPPLICQLHSVYMNVISAFRLKALIAFARRVVAEHSVHVDAFEVLLEHQKLTMSADWSTCQAGCGLQVYLRGVRLPASCGEPEIELRAARA